jgi:2-polyprenyl-3-methyl-5-hydroxy-6-metoxy-1,4-benzoquinol methylase
MIEDYKKFTEYKRYVDLKKLDFIVSSIRNQFNRINLKGLDLGCGKGNVTFPLASLGYEMIGIDMSQDDIGVARSKNIHGINVTFLFGDAEKLSLKKGNFDFAVCSELLEHLIHPSYALSSINDVLKEDGLLIITVPNGYGPFSLTHDFHLYSDCLNILRNEIIPKIFPRTHPSPHVQLFTISKISKLLKKTGFEILKINHSDIISFLPISSRFCYFDCKLADKLPSLFVSGYYIVCKKK